MKHHRPAADHEMDVEFCASGPAVFLISPFWIAGEGWEGECTLASVTLNGQARSREWCTDALGEPAVADWEDRVWTAWVEAHP